jgi:hypothetical protein
MNNYLICGDPRCRFILDVPLHGSKANRRRLSPPSCFSCGGKWTSPHPLPMSAVRAHWSAKLPLASSRTQVAHGAAA